MFSDTITLLATTYIQNEYGEWVAGEPSKKDVFCDLQSLGANEKLRVDIEGYRPEARAVMHLDDYVACDSVYYAGDSILLKGTYKVYRTFVKGDKIELYLASEVGLNG